MFHLKASQYDGGYSATRVGGRFPGGSAAMVTLAACKDEDCIEYPLIDGRR